MDIRALLSRALPESTHTIEGVGDIRIRSLSRSEVIKMRAIQDLDQTEIYIAATCIIDPPMNEDEAQSWLDTADSAEVNEVMTAILTLSRLLEDSQKSS